MSKTTSTVCDFHGCGSTDTYGEMTYENLLYVDEKNASGTHVNLGDALHVDDRSFCRLDLCRPHWEALVRFLCGS